MPEPFIRRASPAKGRRTTIDGHKDRIYVLFIFFAFALALNAFPLRKKKHKLEQKANNAEFLPRKKSGKNWF